MSSFVRELGKERFVGATELQRCPVWGRKPHLPHAGSRAHLRFPEGRGHGGPCLALSKRGPVPE